MHRTRLPKIVFLFGICACLLVLVVFGQTKPAGEVNITKCWAYPTGEAVGEKVASDGSRVFLGLDGAKVEALSLDGKKMWSTELGGEIISNILPLENGVLLVTSAGSNEKGKTDDSVLRSLSKETGITNWTLKLPEANGHVLGGFNGAVVVVSKGGVIQLVDAKSGTVKWKREIAEGFEADPVFIGDKVIVATTAKQIFGISLASGEIDSVRKVLFGVTALGGTRGGELIVGDDRGNVSLLETSGEKAEWTFKSGGEISSVFAIGNHLLVTSHDNFVYFLADRNGTRVWKKRLSGRVAQVGTVIDQYALISSFEEHGAVLTDISTGQVAGQVAFAPDEILVSPPTGSNGIIFVLTNKAAHAYSLSGCVAKK